MVRKLAFGIAGVAFMLVSSDAMALSANASSYFSIGDQKIAGSNQEKKDGAPLHEKVRELYSFKPAKLSKSEMDAKSSELDRFWDLVKSEPARYLPLLRSELRDNSNPSFFFYDGARLLLSLSKEKGDQNLALEAISRPISRMSIL